MEYRINRRTGDRISILGFGTSYIANATEKDAVDTIHVDQMARMKEIANYFC